MHMTMYSICFILLVYTLRIVRRSGINSLFKMLYQGKTTTLLQQMYSIVLFCFYSYITSFTVVDCGLKSGPFFNAFIKIHLHVNMINFIIPGMRNPLFNGILTTNLVLSQSTEIIVITMLHSNLF